MAQEKGHEEILADGVGRIPAKQALQASQAAWLQTKNAEKERYTILLEKMLKPDTCSTKFELNSFFLTRTIRPAKLQISLANGHHSFCESMCLFRYLHVWFKLI